MSSSWEMKQGPNFAPAYQISGTPFVKTVSSVGTSTVVEVTFPFVTRWVTVSAKNNGAGSLRIGFSGNGVASNPDPDYYLLHLGERGTGNFIGSTDRLELRCKSLFLRGDSGTIASVSIAAGVTGIESFPVLTGSNGFKGVG